MKLIVQETSAAFGGEVPESAWRNVSEHRTIKTARAARDLLVAAKRKRCGPAAWDSHQRIVNAGRLPIKWSVAWYCTGWSGREFHLCHNQADAKITWHPGESEPNEWPPRGWSGTQCPECQRAQAEHYA